MQLLQSQQGMALNVLDISFVRKDQLFSFHERVLAFKM